MLYIEAFDMKLLKVCMYFILLASIIITHTVATSSDMTVFPFISVTNDQNCRADCGKKSEVFKNVFLNWCVQFLVVLVCWSDKD
jgi:hypothetical protein